MTDFEVDPSGVVPLHVAVRPRLTRLRRLAALLRSLADAQESERHWLWAWGRGRVGLWVWHRRFDLARRLDPRDTPDPFRPLLVQGPEEFVQNVRLIEWHTPKLVEAGDRLVSAHYSDAATPRRGLFEPAIYSEWHAAVEAWRLAVAATRETPH